MTKAWSRIHDNSELVESGVQVRDADVKRSDGLCGSLNSLIKTRININMGILYSLPHHISIIEYGHRRLNSLQPMYYLPVHTQRYSFKPFDYSLNSFSIALFQRC